MCPIPIKDQRGNHCDVQPEPMRTAETVHAVHDPVVTDDGTCMAGLRLGDRRTQDLLQELPRLLPNGFFNHGLSGLLA